MPESTNIEKKAAEKIMSQRNNSQQKFPEVKKVLKVNNVDKLKLDREKKRVEK
jgi:hypothetical protein